MLKWISTIFNKISLYIFNNVLNTHPQIKYIKNYQNRKNYYFFFLARFVRVYFSRVKLRRF